MSDSIIVVMAHREATDCLIRHWPLWAAHNIPIFVFAPADSIPRIDPSIPLLIYGRAEHHGVESVRRFKWLLRFLEEYGKSFNWVFEYDSFSLKPSIFPDYLVNHEDSFYGGVFQIGDDDKSASFEGHQFVHPPFGITKRALTHLNALDLPDTAERSFWDRWLGLALEKSYPHAIGSYVTQGTGFSRNTIEPEDRAAAVAAVEQGAVWIHGCKDEPTLNAIKTAYARRVTK